MPIVTDAFASHRTTAARCFQCAPIHVGVRNALNPSCSLRANQPALLVAPGFARMRPSQEPGSSALAELIPVFSSGPSTTMAVGCGLPLQVLASGCIFIGYCMSQFTRAALGLRTAASAVPQYLTASRSAYAARPVAVDYEQCMEYKHFMPLFEPWAERIDQLSFGDSLIRAP